MKKIKVWGLGMIIMSTYLLGYSLSPLAATNTAGKSHIGTFEGSTTFRTSSSNGINPGLFLEVRDADGNFKQYTSEDGVITVPNTKEGAYVAQAKLLGKTKYVDQDTGEILDNWEEGRNLELVSVENPGLSTTGKNLFDGIWSATDVTGGGLNIWCENYIEVNSNTAYYYSRTLNSSGWNCTRQYDANFNLIKESNIGFTGGKITLEPNTKYIKIATHKAYIDEPLMISVTKEEYEPYQSNILSTLEDVTLRGIGDVRDELDLITREVVQNINEIVLDENNTWHSYNNGMFYTNALPIKNNVYITSSMLPVKVGSLLWDGEIGIALGGVFVVRPTLEEMTMNEFKKWISDNPIMFHYESSVSDVKTVDLNSTYQFNLVSDSVIQVKGDILPTIYSITVPTEPLTFAINPNAEEGQQFIAPDFSITNESPGPVQLELKSFTQTTNILNDVLPDTHSDWTQLNLAQSRDIALALVPKPSDGWLTLNEGEKYVANTSNTLLGEIKRNTTVDFSFSAFHGGVFNQNLFPEYRLVFTFGF